jgi:hypothetical protein
MSGYIPLDKIREGTWYSLPVHDRTIPEGHILFSVNKKEFLAKIEDSKYIICECGHTLGHTASNGHCYVNVCNSTWPSLPSSLFFYDLGYTMGKVVDPDWDL